MYSQWAQYYRVPSVLLGLWAGTELEPSVKSEKRTAGHEPEGEVLVPGSQDFSVYPGVIKL